jgi:hypothetical protein
LIETQPNILVGCLFRYQNGIFNKKIIQKSTKFMASKYGFFNVQYNKGETNNQQT